LEIIPGGNGAGQDFIKFHQRQFSLCTARREHCQPWLNRPGGSGDHELKVMKPDGSSYFMLVTGADVADIGLGCGN